MIRETVVGQERKGKGRVNEGDHDRPGLEICNSAVERQICCSTREGLVTSIVTDVISVFYVALAFVTMSRHDISLSIRHCFFLKQHVHFPFIAAADSFCFVCFWFIRTRNRRERK